MRLRVDLLPYGDYADVVLVVDVLRATTTAVTYLERGAGALLLTDTPDTALTLRGPGTLLGGERGGLPLEGFDFGNSPVEAAGRSFAGHVVAMNTTNGTAAATTAAQTGRHILLAALTNAHAAARRARALASEEIAIVCAGTEARVGLEDVYAAGVLAEYLLALGEFGIDDGTRVALTIRRNAGNPLDTLASSSHGQHLVRLGLEADIHAAAQISTSPVVPALDRGGSRPGVLRFTSG